MYRCVHYRVVVELRNPAETIETVAARLPGCDELRRQNHATGAEHRKASRDCLRLARIGAEKLGITPEHIGHYAQSLARWTAAGMPMREQAEVERIEAWKPSPRERRQLSFLFVTIRIPVSVTRGVGRTSKRYSGGLLGPFSRIQPAACRWKPQDTGATCVKWIPPLAEFPASRALCRLKKQGNIRYITQAASAIRVSTYSTGEPENRVPDSGISLMWVS